MLIELREYAIAQSANFLDFLHRGRGADWQFDDQLLHQHLQEHSTLVMFDALDEVFDRATQSTVIDDIIRFAQQYPKAQVLVTSRITGYNPERLKHARFRHLTIQPLDNDQIHEFIDRWYDLAMWNDSDKPRLKQRLKDVIANSKAIQNLADNPLLLTMMAILNRRQELPHDRADLYDQALRVLLYHWDVDHKRLQLPMDAIGQREKQEMLRLIAYEMQAGYEGLKGNLISAERLTQVLTYYLRDQSFSEPREKANRLIQQLRERNFILCYRGTDTYGFIHRTFLEYFCATEIVHRFEKQRSLTFEELRRQTFKLHWRNQTWHEVLKLICRMIDAQFAGQLIEWLIDLECYRYEHTGSGLIPDGDSDRYTTCLRKESMANLLLATDCLIEVGKRTAIASLDKTLLTTLQKEVTTESPCPFDRDTATALLEAISTAWAGNPAVLLWFKQFPLNQRNSWVASASIRAIAKRWQYDPQAFNLLKSRALPSEHEAVQLAVMEALAQGWKGNPQALDLLLKVWVQPKTGNTNIRVAAVKAAELSTTKLTILFCFESLIFPLSLFALPVQELFHRYLVQMVVRQASVV